MSTWLDAERKKILNKQFASDILTKSLITDRTLKRKHYTCEDKYITLAQIPIWKQQNNDKEEKEKDTQNMLFSTSRCDITALEIDCIVNAANEGLL